MFMCDKMSSLLSLRPVCNLLFKKKAAKDKDSNGSKQFKTTPPTLTLAHHMASVLQSIASVTMEVCGLGHS